jgi:hypothetical protein
MPKVPEERDDGAPDSNPTRRRIAYVAMGLMAGCLAVSVGVMVIYPFTDLGGVVLWTGGWTILLWLYARRQ